MQIFEAVIPAVEDRDNVIERGVISLTRSRVGIGGLPADSADVVVAFQHSLSMLPMCAGPSLFDGICNRKRSRDPFDALALRTPAIVGPAVLVEIPDTAL